jgi:hypothetical protein
MSSRANSSVRVAVGGALAAVIVLSGCDPYPCTTGFCDPLMADVAQKAGDVGTYLAVGRADEAATGNAELGRAAALEKSGRASVALRVTRATRHTPSVTGVPVRSNGVSASQFPTDQSSVGTISIEGSLGLWRGLPSFGDSRFGGTDLIIGVTRFQDMPDNSLHVVANGSWGESIGFRIGLLDESRTRPALSYSAVVRTVPGFAFQSDQFGTPGVGVSTIGGNVTGLHVRSWRLAAAKEIGRFGLTAAYGSDSYGGDIYYQASINGPSSDQGSRSGTLDVSRTNLMVGAAYRVGVATLAAEFGHLGDAEGGLGDGGCCAPFNQFAGSPFGQSHNYMSIGVRIGPRAVP